MGMKIVLRYKEEAQYFLTKVSFIYAFFTDHANVGDSKELSVFYLHQRAVHLGFKRSLRAK